MIPIGRGQRELIIGDRQIGKTAMAVDAIINQKEQRHPLRLRSYRSEAIDHRQRGAQAGRNGALANTIVVAASASESAALQFIAPYSGCTMGEYFRDRGEDALIVYDDLSKASRGLSSDFPAAAPSAGP